MARPNPAQFIAQVRAEGAKVVLPTRKEATLTTIMVFIMTILAAIFFFLVDSVMNLGVEILLGL